MSYEMFDQLEADMLNDATFNDATFNAVVNIIENPENDRCANVDNLINAYGLKNTYRDAAQILVATSRKADMSLFDAETRSLIAGTVDALLDTTKDRNIEEQPKADATYIIATLHYFSAQCLWSAVVAQNLGPNAKD